MQKLGPWDLCQASQQNKQNFLGCQQGLQGAKIATLGVVLWGLFNGVEVG